MNTTEEIKSRIDIVDLVSESVKLRRAGKNYTGFCPFHANTRTPAFVVFPDTGTWRCFGECSEGGDIFRFIMKKEGWDFPETLRYLAQKAGVTLEPLTPQKKEQNVYEEKLRNILEEAVIFYRHHLTQTEAGKKALSYLLDQRKLTKETIEIFELGYAPASWEDTYKHFQNKGYADKELTDCGLITKRTEKSGYYDRFRNRIVFPIRDGYQHISGFGARALGKDDNPKYLNSPQSLVFDKSALLYGLDKARKPIRAADQVVIVEGYFDVIGLYQAGFQNAVSPMGTALTPIQMRLLKRFTRRLVMALDPDAAGEKATMKGLEVARDAMDHSTDFVFDPKGLLRSEARLDADIRVCSLPDGLDPDEIALDDPEQWTQILAQAKPIITHVIDSLSEGKDLDDPKVKSSIAEQVVPLIKDIPNAVERDTYRQQLARVLHVDERSLFSISETQYVGRKSKKRRKAATAPTTIESVLTAEKNKTYSLERHIVLLLLNKPEYIYDLDRFLNKNELSPFDISDIGSGDLFEVAKVIKESLEQVDMDAEEFIQQSLTNVLQDYAEELEKVIPENTTEDRVLEELIRSLLTLRTIKLNQAINSMTTLQLNGKEDAADPLDQEMQSSILENIRTRAKIDKALSAPFIVT